MMKRLLFCALSALFAFSASAVQKGDYVYTPQGRFLITGDVNLMGTAGSFANLDGWEVATTDTTGNRQLADNFTVGLDTASQVRYAQSLVSTVGEGMKYVSNSLDANTTYVISWKLRNAAETAPTRPLTTATNATHAGAGNLVTVTGTNGSDSTRTVVTYNKADEISSDWITYSYAIVGDGKARTLAISLTAMNANVQIADIQILQAQQVADDRDAKAKAEFIKSIYDLTDWSRFDDDVKNLYPATDLITAYGQVAKITDDMLAYLTDIAGFAPEEIAEMCPGFTEDLETYNKQIATYNASYDSFKSSQWKAYIDVEAETGEHLGQNSGNNQHVNPIGTWTPYIDEAETPSGGNGRGYWRYGWVDIGHYAGSANFTSAELRKEFNLFEGGYTFKADFVGVSRPTTGSGDWNTNYGLTSDDAFVYVTNAEGEIIASSDTTGTATDIDGEWTTKYVTFNIPADGKYTMHMKAIRRYNTNGGQVYFRWPELYGKSFGAYSADEKEYIGAVREQITTGDNNYQIALDSIASEATPWGKTTLQACVDTMGVKKQKYDAIFNDSVAIVKTYDADVYEKGATNPNSLMVYEVYSEYVRDLLAANRKYVAVNDTLKMLNNKIEAAIGLASLTIYQASTGLEALETEIGKAKQLDATLRAADYSEENAKAVTDEVAALEEAMTNCKNSIDPTKLTKVYADIDFEYTSELYDNLVGYTDEMASATITGKVGALEVSQFKKENVEVNEKGVSNDFPYQLGIDVNGEKQYAGYLRAGCSDATVSFNASDLGQNILLVSMDWWWSKLGDLYSGFEILDEDGEQIAGFVVCTNDGKASVNTFNIDPVSNFYSATNKNDAEVLTDAYHSQWTAVLDFANAKQYLIGKVGSKTIYSEPVAMNVTGVPATFKIAGSIGKNKYPGRRNWFDNLKIQKLEITATPTKEGDVNKDGKVDIGDLISVSNVMAGEGGTVTFDDADVNKDTKVDIGDIITIANIMAGNNE